MRCLKAAVVLMAALSAGCTVVPSLVPARDDQPFAGVDFVNSVATHVACELQNAYLDVRAIPGSEWIDSWSAEVTLTMTSVEKGSFHPGLLYGLGVAAVSGSAGLAEDATRASKMTWYIAFADLKRQAGRDAAAKSNDPEIALPKDGCQVRGRYPVQGSLKIAETLAAGVGTPGINKNVFFQGFKSGGPLKVIEHDVTFTSTLSADINPRITLTRVTLNPGGDSLLSGSRARTDELLITMGPSEIEDSKRDLRGNILPPNMAPSNAVRESHSIAQFKSAIRQLRER